MFTGFIIYIHNEFEDEESGHFVKPLPAGVSMEKCHFNQTAQWVITSFGLFQGYLVCIWFSCLVLFGVLPIICLLTTTLFSHFQT